MIAPTDRDLPNAEAIELLALVQQICTERIEPAAAAGEQESRFPRELFTLLGEAGLLGLPYPVEYGGSGQPFEVYLQVIEELARAWLAVGLGVSVHTLSAHALANFGEDSQREEWLGDMLGGELLGAYCLSEAQSGSDAAALSTRAEKTANGYALTGTKAWITHGGEADFYTVMARTSDARAGGISCFLVPGDAAGLSFGQPENKMGMRASTTAQVILDHVEIPQERRIGSEGQGFPIALAALDAGRLGIAACAVGLAQAALDHAVEYCVQRQQFGTAVANFQGLNFMLADMAAAVEASRALYLAAARRKDRGQTFSTQAAMAKLIATDSCMKVCIDAVQALGGSGYVQDFPVERFMREAKVLQIVEGTNQVQRLVIGRSLINK